MMLGQKNVRAMMLGQTMLKHSSSGWNTIVMWLGLIFKTRVIQMLTYLFVRNLLAERLCPRKARATSL